MSSAACWQLMSCDGGEYNPHYGIQNMLVPDEDLVYSTTPGRREDVTVVLRYTGDGPFTLTGVTCAAPTTGFTSPLGQALVFTSWEAPCSGAISRCWSGVSNRHHFQLLTAHHHAQQLRAMKTYLSSKHLAAATCSSSPHSDSSSGQPCSPGSSSWGGLSHSLPIRQCGGSAALAGRMALMLLTGSAAQSTLQASVRSAVLPPGCMPSPPACAAAAYDLLYVALGCMAVLASIATAPMPPEGAANQPQQLAIQQQQQQQQCHHGYHQQGYNSQQPHIIQQQQWEGHAHVNSRLVPQMPPQQGNHIQSPHVPYHHHDSAYVHMPPTHGHVHWEQLGAAGSVDDGQELSSDEGCVGFEPMDVAMHEDLEYEPSYHAAPHRGRSGGGSYPEEHSGAAGGWEGAEHGAAGGWEERSTYAGQRGSYGGQADGRSAELWPSPEASNRIAHSHRIYGGGDSQSPYSRDDVSAGMHRGASKSLEELGGSCPEEEGSDSGMDIASTGMAGGEWSWAVPQEADELGGRGDGDGSGGSYQGLDEGCMVFEPRVLHFGYDHETLVQQGAAGMVVDGRHHEVTAGPHVGTPRWGMQGVHPAAMTLEDHPQGWPGGTGILPPMHYHQQQVESNRYLSLAYSPSGLQAHAAQQHVGHVYSNRVGPATAVQGLPVLAPHRRHGAWGQHGLQHEGLHGATEASAPYGGGRQVVAHLGSHVFDCAAAAGQQQQQQQQQHGTQASAGPRLPAMPPTPAAFIDLLDTNKCTVAVDPPLSGRYVILKMLRSKYMYGENIDVSYLGLHLQSGPQAFGSTAMA